MNIKTRHNFHVEFYQPKDSNYYRVVVRDENTGSNMAIHSPQGNLQESTERRNVLDVLFSAEVFGRIFRQRMFPQDTLIYDTVKTESGTKYVNPRYPSETYKAASTDAIN